MMGKESNVRVQRFIDEAAEFRKTAAWDLLDTDSLRQAYMVLRCATILTDASPALLARAWELLSHVLTSLTTRAEDHTDFTRFGEEKDMAVRYAKIYRDKAQLYGHPVDEG